MQPNDRSIPAPHPARRSSIWSVCSPSRRAVYAAKVNPAASRRPSQKVPTKGASGQSLRPDSAGYNHAFRRQSTCATMPLAAYCAATAGTAVALAGALDRLIARWRLILPHAVDFPAAPTAGKLHTPDAAARRNALRRFQLESAARPAEPTRHGGPPLHGIPTAEQQLGEASIVSHQREFRASIPTAFHSVDLDDKASRERFPQRSERHRLQSIARRRFSSRFLALGQILAQVPDARRNR